MTEPATPRPRPCSSCPYRKDVPSGVWRPEEYEKLPGYDGETGDQSFNAFFCHQADGKVCSGWLGHRDPYDLMAVRLGILRGDLDVSCMDYQTDVPLFATGAEAAEHGMADVDAPGPEAREVVDKVIKVHARRARKS